MPTAALSPPSVTITELIARLDALSNHEPCHLAFDGDGTLWSGDVSDDVFLSACHANWFLDSVRPLLTLILREHGLSSSGPLGRVLERVYQAEKQGTLDEQTLFEIMTWCYAGRSFDEVSAYAERVLTELDIDSRLRREHLPLLDWARSSGHTCWLVTASPWPIVRVVAYRFGFDDDHIIAARPVVSDAGIIEAGMRAPVPYSEQKVVQLSARRNSHRLLAAFGDSRFDIELLASAELAVAVSPKPALLDRLHVLERAVLLML